MSDQAVGWQIEAFRESDELLAWSVDLPAGVSHQTLETVLGMDDLSVPEGYPISAEQVRALLDCFDTPAGTVGQLDEDRFAYFISAFADPRIATEDSNPLAQNTATDRR
ncbi:hypothetical protein DMP23_19490 [Amycolatopsis sp. A1MSW2902]|uniref:DUF7683 domain-containing protein n=1 Tax=Amycolatopsis sp. A1MSW2902 TaxID=687413 RepID=UPI00307DBA11